MRILLSNIYYYPNLAGGAEISVMKLAETLAKDADNKVSVLCASDDDGCVSDVINNVAVYRIPLQGNKRGRIKSRINRVCNFTDYSLIKDTIRSIDPEVIHTNNLRTFSVLIWKAAYELKIPIVHTLRDYVLIDIYKYWVEKRIISHYSNLVTAITAPSQCTLNLHLEKGLFKEAKVKCSITNAIDFDIGEVNMLFQKKKKSREEDKQVFQFAYIGRFSEEKGVDWLIKIFSMHPENKKLHLFGSGVLKDETKRIIKQHREIIEHGKLSEDKLNLALEKIDVVVVPSLWEEPFGRVILDAYKNGIPVIVTNRGGMPENVIRDRTGVIIESNDSELESAIKKMCNVEVIDRMCENILEILPHYTVESQADSFLKLYGQIK